MTKYPAGSSELQSFGSTVQEGAIHSARERVVGRAGRGGQLATWHFQSESRRVDRKCGRDLRLQQLPQ